MRLGGGRRTLRETWRVLGVRAMRLFNSENFAGSTSSVEVCALLSVVLHVHVVILRAKHSGAVYCIRSCLWVCLCVGVCYHDNSKLRSSIFTKLGP